MDHRDDCAPEAQPSAITMLSRLLRERNELQALVEVLRGRPDARALDRLVATRDELDRQKALTEAALLKIEKLQSELAKTRNLYEGSEANRVEWERLAGANRSDLDALNVDYKAVVAHFHSELSHARYLLGIRPGRDEKSHVTIIVTLVAALIVSVGLALSLVMR
jgi:hypothetical protein